MGWVFNPIYKEKHGKEPGDYVFDTKDERTMFLASLRTIEQELGAKHLMVVKTEGYNCHTHTKVHRVTRWNDKDYYTEQDMGVNYPYSAAQYYMQYKWSPGFNDYPMGEDFDYDKEKWEIIQEWITGAFDLQDE